ncbi:MULTISPECIES: LytTR family DNA-binding domain-containing protein [unclassified Pseudonocardia]|uniref:LytR/AlgR family response regulator transcription factor n=1 Tax=unclassified Pseudonocardia TaxID=2619320 RepID=UPI00095A52DD|nr:MULTISPECIES: LytTR family DNA-binding domain-containing protein [unclassified Pseudonocardia]MBN9097549.1 response regulator transcription factor [Pseudonocardia sp.]OJY39871.1 MAG: DNA-binding response regulator [Pseudonocardia sp. 73-21]
MKVLAVDDVAPALDELHRLLQESPGVDEVSTAGDALTALKLLQAHTFDVVFLDVSMPAMDGMELAALVARMTDPPVIVFVTAFEEHAASAYDVGALDYLLKPVSADRLAAALDRVRRFAGHSAPTVDALAAVPVELGGRTRFVRRDEVRYVEAQGDYVRLHTPSGAHLVRIPISRLEEHWRPAGFVRVHRSYLLAVAGVRELRSDIAGGLLAHTDVGDVPVSRRHGRELRELLLEAATRGAFDGGRR